MKQFKEPRELQLWCAQKRLEGQKIALVPTMGYLHEGHLSLIAKAKEQGADEIVVSVFVNPVQFGPNEDYAQYPRDEQADLDKCTRAGATAIFFPTPETMYAPDFSVWVNEDGALSNTLCGTRRPGHFRGVCTVVAKLLNLVHPHWAIFGQKDFQQETIIRRMVRDLNFDVEIVVAPIVREESGLARSSRNTYLSPDEKAHACALSRVLAQAKRDVHEQKKIPWHTYCLGIFKTLGEAHLDVDYVEAVEQETLKPVDTLQSGVVILLAVYCGKTRLIDNAIM